MNLYKGFLKYILNLAINETKARMKIIGWTEINRILIRDFCRPWQKLRASKKYSFIYLHLKN